MKARWEEANFAAEVLGFAEEMRLLICYCSLKNILGTKKAIVHSVFSLL